MKYKVGQIIISMEAFKAKELAYYIVIDVTGIPVVQYSTGQTFQSRTSLENLSTKYLIFESLQELKLVLL